MTDLREWLASIGLGQYTDLFVRNDIVSGVLADINEQDLEKLGISLGHRKRLLKAISEYCASHSFTPGFRHEVRRLAASASIKPERRHLTIMFGDLVGSTSLSARLDPEDLRQILSEFQRCCSGAIRAFDGHIARFLGDGVLAYFGFPASREGDAERAVGAALRIVESLAKNRSVERLQVRIGIASGLVVAGDLIGDGSAAEFVLVGEAPNLAARLQRLAAPNQILVSNSTRRLLGNLFELDDFGEHRLRGLEQSTRVWKVLAHRTLPTRFEALHPSQLTPLIGREPELAFLYDKCIKADRGQGQVVMISGDPGIGKSRLSMELTQRLSQHHTLICLQCSAYHTSSAWYPIIRYLEREAGIVNDAPFETRLEKLQVLVRQWMPESEDTIGPLAGLLSISTGTRYAWRDLTPQQQKTRIFTALLNLLKAQAEQQLVLVLVEDVHWVDPTTLEFLERLRDYLLTCRICVLVLFRSQLSLAWAGFAQVSSLSIDRLERNEIASMTKALSANADLSSTITDQIIIKSDGVPLFVEEMTKAVLEHHNPQSDVSTCALETAVPDTLHESLMARLDLVAPMKVVAQIAAVIGREFSLELLQTVSEISREDINAAITHLIAAGLFFTSGRPEDGIFTFKHALVQDEAYASLLRDERRQFHLRTARALCGPLVELGNKSPEVVAHHYTQAGELKSAIDYWVKASQYAGERFAFAEASAHVQMALTLLASLAASRERDELELRLQYSLGTALIAVKGFSAPETGDAFNRALNLCQKLKDDSPQTIMILHGIIGFQATKGDFEDCRKLGEDLVRRAGPNGNVTQRLIGHRARGMSQFLTGELNDARFQLKAAISLYDAQPEPATLIFPQDLKSTTQAFLALTCVLVGDIKEGFGQAEAAVARAEQLRHPHSICYVLTFLAGAHILCREPKRAYDIVERSVALSVEYGLPLWIAGGQMLRGCARVELGETDQGLDEVRQSIKALETTGALIWVQFARYLYAQALSSVGQRADALKLVDDTLSAIPATSGRWYEAELYRLRGDLLCEVPVTAITDCYEKAIATAASQGARLWQLRATNALAAVWLAQGRASDVRSRLAPLCDSFGDDVSFVDLRQAKKLLRL